MNDDELRDAKTIDLSKADRRLLSDFGAKVVEGTRSEADDLAFARDVSDDGFHKLTTCHFSDVAQTAIDSLPFLTKRAAMKKLREPESAAAFLASIEYWQKQLLAAVEVESRERA